MSKGFLSLLVALCAMSVMCASTALGAAPGTGWEVNSHSYPTNLAPGGSGVIVVDVYNVGSLAGGTPVTVLDTLPVGVSGVSSMGWVCSGAVPDVCTQEFSESVTVETDIELPLEVNVDGGAVEGRFENAATVSGGGAASPASMSNLLTISSQPANFGFADADAWFTNADGTSDMQAGSHPYEVSVTFDLNANGENGPANHEEARNLTVALPRGLIGNPSSLPRCTRRQFDLERCPASAQVGIARAGLGGQGGTTPFTVTPSVFNLVPPANAPAQLAFNVAGVHAFIDAGVRSGGDYGLTMHVNDSPQRSIVRSRVTLWGMPGDLSHDTERRAANCFGGCVSGAPLVPFLTLPGACSGPQAFSISSDIWGPVSKEAELSFVTHDSSGVPAGIEGCEHLKLEPSIAVTPDTSQGNTPAGVTFDVKVPQEGLADPEGLAEADVKDATVTLPQGLAINPGRATDLAACQAAEDGVGGEGPPSCPAASRIGSAVVTTPLLGDKLEGWIYVLQSNPPNLQILIAASADGVNLKLVGNVHLDEATGQVTTRFTETPQLPFTDLKLTFDGGPQAALTTPASCGSYATTSDFTPWSTPQTLDALPSSSFSITGGPGGSACSAGLGFDPSFVAGTTNNQAGAFSPLSVTISRGDSDQDLGGVRVTTPPGLLGLLKSVERCGEPQASQGTCGQGSLIGHTTVAVGLGSAPLNVQGGQVFLTGPYKGAPFGLSIVVPAVAGPFNLGNVVVRAAVNVDPHTAQIMVSSDPLPAILDGVPLQLKTVNVSIDREGFMFNPTNCEPLSVSGALTSAQGASASVSSHFQAANCAALAFKPKFTVSTQAKTSKKNGASLDVKVAYPQGSEANIRSVAVTLPKQLPSRLTTIQQACPEATFNANPASCPVGSNIGLATAHTPVLASALSGPAFLVSHGGASFPDLVLILQGEGVTLDLTGSINIKKGVTSSAFASVPDAPISSFELSLPEGPHSGLAAVVPAKAKGNLCGTSLVMPTTITGQNGAQIKQSTKIAVTGCAKAKKKPKAKKHGKAKKKKK